MNYKIIPQSEDAQWSLRLNELKELIAQEMYTTVLHANEPYQTTVGLMAKEIKHLTELLIPQDEETLHAENIRLKVEFKHKDVEILALQRRLFSRKNILQHLFDK